MCTALYMMVLYDQAREGPTTKTSDEISIICLLWLILQANPSFCFWVVVFELLRSQMSIPYLPKWCSHTPMWILILLDNQDCHVNPFSLACLSSSGSDHFNIRKSKYQFFSMVFVSSVPKLPLFFRPPTLFLQGIWCLNQVSFYSCEVSPSFSVNILIRWFSGRF